MSKFSPITTSKLVHQAIIVCRDGGSWRVVALLPTFPSLKARSFFFLLYTQSTHGGGLPYVLLLEGTYSALEALKALETHKAHKALKALKAS